MSVKTGVSFSDVLVSEQEINEIKDELVNDIKLLKRIIKELYRQNKVLKQRIESVEKQASSAEEAATQLRVEMELLHGKIN